ncbi:MAG: DUF4249 domain-containing protein [Bacteroidales bacterium]|nr:DUF4249 domain-containing protein [Bacteroidales bacterium]
MRTRYANILLCLAVLLSDIACTYPFELNPKQVKDVQFTPVIQGDILVGEITHVELGYMISLIQDESLLSKHPSGTAWIENQNGEIFRPEGENADKPGYSFDIDTRSADPTSLYRLRVEAQVIDKNDPEGKNLVERSYSSQWVQVCPAPVLDSLSRTYDDKDVTVRISLHSEDGSEHFRWTFVENWQYHADYIPDYYYDQKKDEVVFKRDESMYWCWNTAVSSEVDLCATTQLGENRIVDKPFSIIHRSSQKLSSRYVIRVAARTLDKQAYQYLENLRLTSNYTGSLFSPNPSSIRGNISCDQDPAEQVIGYIGAGKVSTKYLIINSDEGLYKSSEKPEVLFRPVTGEEPGEEDGQPLWWFYKQGYVPVKMGQDPESGLTRVLWGSKRCIDCRMAGGTTTKPIDWEEESL